MIDLTKDIQRVQSKYPNLTFDSKEDARDFVNIYNILEYAHKEVDPIILLKAYIQRRDVELKSANDYYYLIARSMLGADDIRKTAYPNTFGMTERSIDEVDLDQWISLVHKIHNAVDTSKMTFPKALDFYSEILDKRTGENERFKKWVLYYKNGEYKKYTSEEQMGIKKESDFQFGLSSSSYGGPPVSRDESVIQKLKDLDNSDKNETDFNEWKSKVNGAIRRIDKLLRSDKHLTPEEQADLAELLHSFDLQMRSVRLKSTASDITHRAAGTFKKVGYSDIYNILNKVAQELEEPMAPAAEPIPEAPQMPPEASAQPIEGAQAPAAAGAAETIGRALQAGEPNDEGYGDVFNEIARSGGNIDLGHAASKLEDVAARLADRRTIRQLAEFDIMLDKLGIAALFPELAEAQSKLIDAYSYALVRVTKMLGMLASGRSMSDISNAKKTDISNKAIRDVNKTLTQINEPIVGGKGTESLNSELGPQTPEEVAPAPAPAAPPAPIG